MKIATTLVVTGLLLITASAVSAATNDSAQAPTATAPAQSGQTLLVGDSLVSNLSGNCGADANQQIAAGTAEPTPQGPLQFCGSCSTGGCAGRERGSICYLGGPVTWGHCNIYSGGYLCSTGSWECQCGYGPLP
jgi:hypothetical protein